MARTFESKLAKLCECGCGRETSPSKRFVHGHNLRPIDPRRRLENRLAPPDPITGCIEFLGHRHKGYGQIYADGKLEYAHRLAWKLAGRGYPPGKPYLLHKCDNPACCNVDHLIAGSCFDNQGDMAIKGRGPKSRRGLPFGVTSNGAKWAAQVTFQYINHYCGTFDTVEEAARAAAQKKEELRGASKV